MFIILITVLAMLIVNFGNGIIIKNFFKIEDQSFVLISFLGIIGITFLSTITAFFFPLNSILEIILLITGLIGTENFLTGKARFQINVKFDFWFYFFVFVIIFSASFSPYLFDHFSYYVPTI